ncbi:cytochrome P450 [Xylariaceae sp. AK1471]|nr:cytochrome P450 [Xylariaceae sp. AK1471]
MADITFILGLISSILILFSCVRLLYSNCRPSNFPPGPPRLPLLGNLHQIPLEKGYLKIAELCRKYGSHGLMGLQLGPSTHIVVINSWRVARDLLEQRGAIYSSRPPILAAQEVLPPPGDFHLAFLQYGSKWRKERKTFMEFLKSSEIDKRLPIQEAESSQFMYELLLEPERFHEHGFRYHGAIIMASAFGQRGKEYADNSEVKRFFDVEKDWAIIIAPGFIPPHDIFPFLKIMPDFLTPWRGWKQKTRSVRQRQQALYQDLFAGVKDRMAQGRSQECFLADVLRNNEKYGYSDVDLAYIGGVLLEGGTETTASAFETFLLVMVAYPSFLKKAQEEVDGFYGNDKMPTGTSDAELPFLAACLLEILRWRPGIASGIPHATTQDDTYEGFFIPANTTILMNIWGINHDPEEFDNPEVFDPTRFLHDPNGAKRGTGDVPNDNSSNHLRRPVWTFGGGRRVCVGQHMAQKSMLLTMAKVVWCFDIEAVSPDKLDMSINGFDTGLVTCPKPFEARFRVRGEDRKHIIEREWEKADAYLKQFE